MSATALLIWVRGPGLALALALCLFGIVARTVEMLALGRRVDRAPARANSPGSGWRTLMTRSLPPPGMFKRAPVTYLGGYVFHVGLAIVVFFFVPHIELVRGVLGLRWPGLPAAAVDAATVAALLAMLAVLIDRLRNPVKRFLSGKGDWLAWALTFAPLATGYAAYHHVFENYTLTLALHILTVELLIAALPFTKLFHAISIVFSRWYGGAIAARKGVAS